ncbi:MAG: phage portal protein [Clostridia bacterium]|nr:phage portal protein [Clostridia bacterium]
MSLFTRIFGRREAPAPVKRESDDVEHPTPPTPRQGGTLWPFYSGNTALCVATVFRCVKLLSESVAALPVQVMRRKGGIFVDDIDSRLSFLMNVQPDEYMSAFDMWAQAVQQVLLEGNAYIVPEYSSATMDFHRLVLCAKGTVALDTVGGIYHVNDYVNGISGEFREDEIIHLKGMTRADQRIGLSVLDFARLTMDIARVGDSETYDRFKNGGNVRGLVGNDTSVRGFGEYQDKELEKTATDIDGRFRHGERIVSLPGQVEFKPLSLSSTDLQFLESRKFTVREICRFFGVPPSFVFDDTSNNYKSAEMANVAFLSNTLNPLLRNIESELQRKLFLPSQYGRKRIQFDRRGLYACDLDSRVKYQTATIAAGLYTVNEWRAEENKPAVEGGDKVLVSANLKGIEELTAQPAPEEPQNPETNEE